MATKSYLIRQAAYQSSHQEGKADTATEQKQQPPRQDVEFGSPEFGQGINDVNATMPAGAGRDTTNCGK